MFISWINNGTGSSVIFEMESQAEGYVSLAFSDDTAMVGIRQGGQPHTYTDTHTDIQMDRRTDRISDWMLCVSGLL